MWAEYLFVLFSLSRFINLNPTSLFLIPFHSSNQQSFPLIPVCWIIHQHNFHLYVFHVFCTHYHKLTAYFVLLIILIKLMYCTLINCMHFTCNFVCQQDTQYCRDLPRLTPKRQLTSLWSKLPVHPWFYFILCSLNIYLPLTYHLIILYHSLEIY